MEGIGTGDSADREAMASSMPAFLAAKEERVARKSVTIFCCEASASASAALMDDREMRAEWMPARAEARGIVCDGGSCDCWV